MPNKANKQGYTIVEVMIFLIVSGLMFVIAAVFINGKQAKAEFRQGMNAINSQIQQSINEVSNGYYASDENVKCTIVSGVPTISSPGQERGTSDKCVFLGKYLEFSSGDAQTYKIVAVAGLRNPAAGSITDSPKNFVETSPTISTSNVTNQTKKLQWGLAIEKMSTTGDPDIGGIGFFNGFAKGTDGSGHQSVVALPIHFALGHPATNLDASRMDNDSNISPTTIMCFDGGNGQFGTITIGATGQRLNTTMLIGTKDSLVGCH